jgi:hypothetical protein
VVVRLDERSGGVHDHTTECGCRESEHCGSSFGVRQRTAVQIDYVGDQLDAIQIDVGGSDGVAEQQRLRSRTADVVGIDRAGP